MHRRTNLRPLGEISLLRNKLKVKILFVIAVVFFVGDTPAYAECDDVVTNVCSGWISFPIDSNSYKINYCRSRPVGDGAAGYDLAIVVIHGCERNAPDYFNDVNDLVAAENKDETSVVIAPQFLRKDSDVNDIDENGLGDDILYWSNNVGYWATGYNSANSDIASGDQISSFAVVDEFIYRLAANYPDLERIVVIGHSAGGQFVTRYVAGTKLPEELLYPMGIDIRFIVANPSTYLYFNKQRWDGVNTNPYVWREPNSAEDCWPESTHYDSYRYGLGNIATTSCTYMSDVDPVDPCAVILAQYQQRDVVFLLGDQDTGTASLNQSCAANLQGQHRYERGTVYYHYLQYFFDSIGQMQRKVVVPGVGHDHDAMFTSAQGKEYIFYALQRPMDVDAADGTSTSGVQITWDSVTDATSYHVRRATAPEGTWFDIGSWQSGTTYTDTTATAGTTYFYSVVAKNAARNSIRSPYTTGWKKLLPPTGILASDGNYTDKVNVTWNIVTGATHYEVYRATSAGGAKTAMSGWQTATSYNDTSATPGVTYYYWVKAATSSGGARQSEYSSNNTGWRKLSPPTGVSASDGDYTDKVEIYWDSVSGASHYRVHRSTSAGGTKTALGSWQSGTSYNDTSATPGVTYYYWLTAATSSGGVRESEYSSYNTGWRLLSAAGGVSASKGDYTDRVEITWSVAAGASHYRVYRATSAGGTKTALGSWQSGTTYNDTSAIPGLTYYYWVTSATSSGGDNESGYGSYDTGWRKLTPPTNVDASDDTYTDKIRITWNSVTGASYYRVYRATSAGGTKTALGSWTTNTTYDDTSAQTGTTYYYWVTAATSSDGACESDFSSYDTGTRQSLLLPPTGVSATDGTHTDKVQINWNFVDGATHYQVYRAISAGGTKTAISPWQASLNYYYDTTAIAGTTYYYWVKAATSSGGADASDYSSYDTGWRFLLPPTSVDATDGGYTNKIDVTWNPSAGASHYKVYYGLAQFGSKTPLSSWQTGTSYTHTDPVPGESYWYWIKAATSSGGDRESDYSEVDDGWALLSPPTSVSASDGTYADKVTVTWSAPPGATYYQVYRATSPGGAKTAINDWQMGASYDDTDATPGVTYYYWVKASVSMSGWRSTDYSSYDSGWCLLSIGFDSAASEGLETTSLTNINVVLSHPTTGQKTVNYAVTGGTAANGTDYNLSPATIIFAPGQTSKFIDANVIYDGLAESDETIQITLSSPAGGNVILGAITQHTYTILDNFLYTVCPDGSGDFTTIQAGIGAAFDRDVVELCDATYTGTANKNIEYAGKAITVRSKSGNPENCIINCQNSGRGFKFVNDEDSDSILEGVTITAGTGTSPGGGGILCGLNSIMPPGNYHGSPTINNCIISNCYMGGTLMNPAYGGGMYCHENSSPTLNNCQFISNSVGGFGSITTIGGALYCYGGSAVFNGCTFKDNTAGTSGGAFAAEGGTFDFDNCTFKNNSADLGGAVICNGAEAAFDYCTFNQNTADIDGGAIFFTQSSIRHLYMGNCTLYANSAPFGSGLFLHTVSINRVYIDNTIIAFGVDGEAVDSASASATLTCCDVYGNAGGDWVSTIAGQGTLRNNISLDPLFCNAANDNFYLKAASPCLPFSAPNPPCDLIGAWPLGYPGDLNKDGVVDFSDYADFAIQWEQSECGVCGGADLADSDSYVGTADLWEFVIDWMEGLE